MEEWPREDAGILDCLKLEDQNTIVCINSKWHDSINQSYVGMAPMCNISNT